MLDSKFSTRELVNRDPVGNLIFYRFCMRF